MDQGIAALVGSAVTLTVGGATYWAARRQPKTQGHVQHLATVRSERRDTYLSFVAAAADVTKAWAGITGLTSPYLHHQAEPPDWRQVHTRLDTIDEEQLRELGKAKERLTVTGSSEAQERATHWLGAWVLQIGHYYNLCHDGRADQDWHTINNAYGENLQEARAAFMKVVASELRAG